MSNVISINNKKENVIEFNLTLEGVESKGAKVKMVVETKDMEIGFKATHKEKDTWSVKLPKLPILERTAYKFYIEVQVDGYFFEAFKGTLNVVGSAEVYSSEPKNVTLKADEEKEEKKTKKEEKKVKKVSEVWRGSEKPIEQIANELMEKHNLSPEAITEKVEEARVAAETGQSSKDDAVRSILEQAGFHTKKKRERFSFINH